MLKAHASPGLAMMQLAVALAVPDADGEADATAEAAAGIAETRGAIAKVRTAPRMASIAHILSVCVQSAC